VNGPVEPKKGVAHQSPSFEVSGDAEFADYWAPGFYGVYEELLNNLKKPRPPFSTRYAQPSPIYAGAYLWDSAFIVKP